jgi:diaminopimelate epimerase
VRKLPFTKASACGNDFLIVERAELPSGLDQQRISVEMCDRYNGIGADGVEWISPGRSEGAEIQADLINSDGSPAEISGNGTRCVAAWYTERHSERKAVNVGTGAGLKHCTLIALRSGTYEFEMAMGRPLNVEERTVAKQNGVVVDLGNPHFVLVVGSFGFDWQELAARLQADTGAFRHGTNVEFVRVLNQHTLEVRFFERGAGETRSSGTGSCASAIAAAFSRMCTSPITVNAPGGAQIVRIEDQTYLRGEARLICTGEFSISG